jgi:hypothetical protein
MEKAKLEDITLDEEDAKLFKLKGDYLLQAKAIKYSILPKLNIIFEEALSQVRKVYGVEVFNEGSIITSWPNFREKRNNALKFNYSSAYIGIGGSRTPIWDGFTRKDGKPIKIIPYTFGFLFDEYGITLQFDSCRYQLEIADNSLEKYINFVIKNNSVIQTIQSIFGMLPSFNYELLKIIPFEELLIEIKKTRYKILNYSRTFHFPLGVYEFGRIVESFLTFYQIYDSVIKIAKGKEPIFNELISMIEYIYNKNNDTKNDMEDNLNKEETENILSGKLDTINPVRAGMRWQVFERDDFKCVACGKSANDGAILHVDHIIPRSKGGKDEMDNYQTLCHLCNIGKSNKSVKELRKK